MHFGQYAFALLYEMYLEELQRAGEPGWATPSVDNRDEIASTILENNIVQTIGSAGESIAGGVVFTIPALIFLTPNGPGYFNYLQITMLTFAGGILGVLMMVPPRAGPRKDRGAGAPLGRDSGVLFHLLQLHQQFGSERV